MKLSELKPLHDLGFSLIWLRESEKRPLSSGWTSGPRSTWKELKDSHDTRYNVGVRLGETSQIEGGYFLMCLDLDIKDPAFKKAAEATLAEVVGDQKFVEVRSGSGNGSRHLYGVSKKPFRMVEIEKHKNKWELCAYSTGRQMVLPPSIHPSGRPYIWLNGKPEHLGQFALFDPCPWKKEKAHAGSSDEGGEKFKAVEVDLYSSALPVRVIKMIEEGEGVEDRSAAVLSIAMHMCRAGMSDNEILSVLSDSNNFIGGAALERRGNRKSAVKWLEKYALSKARYETNPMRLFDNPPKDRHPLSKKQAAKVGAAIVHENNELGLPDKDGNGKYKPTLRNVVHVLEHSMGGGLVAFNEFNSRGYFMKPTVYGGEVGREISNKDDLALKHYIACHYGFEPSKELCVEAHALVAQKYRYHPIRDYLRGLEWDGVPRLDTWLREAFSASGPEHYLNAVSRKVLAAAVSRVFEPGCKFDYVLVLEGNQGKGKSMALRILASQPWFTDGLGDIRNKDVVDQMLGKWVIELSELASIRGSENEHTKSFLSREVDRVRLSYERRAEDFPRQSIFIGSTNAQEYFTDETGNRRYWPVKIGVINRQWIRRNRDQLWAEAMLRYKLGEDLYLSDEIEELAKREQEKRFEVDEWEVIVKGIVKKEADGVFVSTELWRAINFNSGNGQPTTADSRRIGRIMHRIGFVRTTRRIDGVLGKCWVKR